MNRAKRAEGSVDKNGDGVDVTLIKNAEDDIDGHQRRNDQKRLGRERRLKGLQRSGEVRRRFNPASPTVGVIISRAYHRKCAGENRTPDWRWHIT